MSVWWSRTRREPVRTPARTGGVPWFQPWVGVGGASYADVNALEGTTSLQKVAMWSSIDLIASLVSEMPIDVMRDDGDTAKTLPTPGYLQDPSGDGNGLQDWAWQLLLNWLTGGNNFGNVLSRDRRGGFATQVELWPPDKISGTLDSDGNPQWTIQGQEIPRERMWHLRAYPRSGQVLGLSPVAHHVTTVTQGLASARFGAQFFTDGAIPQSIVQNTEAEIDQTQAISVKARWMAALKGSREPVVWGKGWKYEQVQVNPDESQFLETQRYSGKECARIFGPGVAELLGYVDEESMTYSNVVDRRADFLVLSGNKWVNRFERVLTAMLPRGQFVRANRNALLQATTLDRFKAYELALKNKFMVPNEARAFEDWAPVPWGDEPITVSGPAAPNAKGGTDGADAA